MNSGNQEASRFISLRWRLILPTFAVVLILAMVVTYVVARSLPSSADSSRVNVLRNTGHSLSDHAAALYQDQLAYAQQLAGQPDVATALSQGRASDLKALLTNFTRRADLDALFLTDLSGQPVYGIALNDGAYVPAQAVDNVIFAQAPVVAANGVTVGNVLVGVRSDRWLDTVRGSAAAEIALYQDAHIVASTLQALPSGLPDGYSTPGEPFQALDYNGSIYLGAYFPINSGQLTLAVFMPDVAPFAAEAGQQLIALTLATVVAAVVIAVFVITNYLLDRVNRVRQVVEALATGEHGARTGMLPTDEISALGHAVDVFAERVEERHDRLRASLRRQRREIEYLNAVLESLPDGAIVQDLDGNVTFINERAKRLVGETYNFFKRTELREITAAVTDVLGAALAPGLYALGTPLRMELDGRTLAIQALAVMSLADQRVGTVILVHDASADVRRERARAVLLNHMEDNVAEPIAVEAAFSHEMKRNVATLQKLIVEMRELVANIDAPLVQATERKLPLETLVWAVANEWRQVAQAANLTLNVSIERSGLHVVGDERRLRWAIGNIVDNAIKYTPPGGKVSIEIKDEEMGFARLRVRDNGVGIVPDELPHVFKRFYRGTPINTNGRALRVPGTGQGLTIARQIVEAHGGRIYLRSSPGVGTAVYFTLPLAETSYELPVIAEEEEETIRVRDASGR